jgi:hypothetical protein
MLKLVHWPDDIDAASFANAEPLPDTPTGQAAEAAVVVPAVMIGGGHGTAARLVCANRPPAAPVAVRRKVLRFINFISKSVRLLRQRVH